MPLTEIDSLKDIVGKNPFAAGWGHTQQNGQSSKVLQEVALEVISNQKCHEIYNSKNIFLSKGQFGNAVICAGYETESKDTWYIFIIGLKITLFLLIINYFIVREIREDL